ncbi:MAG: hypothetical protein KGH94_04440 [Candidatus Micrarchaeota archaeon]|nr:hypothetical protein [Candidatus Micrarchaeota archaeon]
MSTNQKLRRSAYMQSEAKLSEVTARENLHSAHKAARSSKVPLRMTMPNEFKPQIMISHSPSGESATWATARHHSMSVEEALKIASDGTLDQRIELAGSTPHEKAQTRLIRDPSHKVYDKLVRNPYLRPAVLEKMISSATIGQNYSAAAFLRGRLENIGMRAVEQRPEGSQPKNNGAQRKA